MNGFNLLRFVCRRSGFGLLPLLLIGGCSFSSAPPQDPIPFPERVGEYSEVGEPEPMEFAAADAVADAGADSAGEFEDPTRPVPEVATSKTAYSNATYNSASSVNPVNSANSAPGIASARAGLRRPPPPIYRFSRRTPAVPRAGRKANRPARKAGKDPLRLLPLEDYLALAPYLEGQASWYGPTFHGKRTANGEVYNQYGLSAAHPVLPMGTRIRVDNLENGKSVRLRVNDRGPYKKGRVVDLTRSAAVRLGMIKKGTAPVRITVERWPFKMNPAQGLKAYGQYIVQVAAFPDPLKAETERRGLRERFEEVSFRVNRTRKGLFAIYAGPFDDEQAARRLASTLRKSGVKSLVRAYRK